MATSDAQLEALLTLFPQEVRDAARALHFGLFIEWRADDAMPAGGWECNARLEAARPAGHPLLPPTGRRRGGQRIPVLSSVWGRAAGGMWLDEIVAPEFDVNALLRRFQVEAAREVAAQRQAGAAHPDEHYVATIRADPAGRAVLYYSPRWRADAPA